MRVRPVCGGEAAVTGRTGSQIVPAVVVLWSGMANLASMRDERTYAIIGAAMEVHRIVGGGFGENACADALAIELGLRKIPFRTGVPFPVHYKGHRLRSFYRADFVCFDSGIVELKV